jgi:aromatic amino acid permease
LFFNIVGGFRSLDLLWFAVAASEIKLRPEMEAEALPVKMWGYPYAGYVALIGLRIVAVLMLFDNSAPQVMSPLVYSSPHWFALSAVARRRNASAVPTK